VRLAEKVKQVAKTLGCFVSEARRSSYHLFRLPAAIAGLQCGDRWPVTSPSTPRADFIQEAAIPNPLRAYFEANREGPGIWKWNHYFDIYHRHLRRFVGSDVHVVEVGVYSGGSLPMWRSYFGGRCHVTGVDIEPACRAYESDRISIHIGDQADREFWRTFRRDAGLVDVLIDDGGHSAEQQIVTLEEMLPYLRPGGVYICEDIHGFGQQFSTYAYSLGEALNEWVAVDSHGEHASGASRFQAAVYSIHLYPFVVVIERTESPVDGFRAPKHGTQWQPFL